MQRDRSKWNAKYRKGDPPQEASDIVRRFHRLAPGPRALDLAAGGGRNALFLAGHGFQVDAVDISEEGLARFAAPGVRRACVDLDAFDIPPERYDLIINVLYVNRRLFPQLREGLRPGGVLIFESLLAGAGGGEGERTCRDYLLHENELLHSFLRLQVLHYREADESEGGESRRRLASLVARRV
jgi:tellurite methyltransferase